MSISELVRSMAAAGASPEAIALAVEAIEARDIAEREQKAKRAAARARQRADKNLRDMVATVARQSADNKATVGDVDATIDDTSCDAPPGFPPQEIITQPPFSVPPTLHSSPNGSASPNGHPIAKPKRERRSEDVALIQAVVGDWNDLAASLRLPEVRDITPARQAAVLARARDLVATFEFPDPRSGFNEIFARIRGSPFLRGETNGFRCDFDFAVKQSSFTKIMEGKYEARAQTNGQYARS